MADPMTYYQVAVGAAKFFGERQRAAEQEARRQQAYLSAVNARDLKIQQLQTQSAQQAELYADKKLQSSIQALKAQEAIINAATLGGNNLNLKILDVEAQKLRADTAYTTQNERIQDNIEFTAYGFEQEAINRANSVAAGSPPSFGMAVLQTAASAYATERAYTGKSIPADSPTNVNVIPTVPPLIEAVRETN